MTGISRNPADPGASSQDAEKTRALLADLWRRNRPVIEERLAILDHAARAPFPMPEDLRLAALDVAHKLSGSLGMFGFDHGSVIAAQIEQMLDAPLPDTPLLGDLAKELREMLLPSS